MTERYEIRIKTLLGPEWSGYFDGFNLQPAPNGETILTGEIIDQAALHGLLGYIRDLGLPLLSVNPLFSGQEESGDNGVEPLSQGK